MLSLPLFNYALKAAMRDRLVWSLAAGLIVVCSLSVFMGSTAISEQREFTLVFASAGLRSLAMLGLTLFVIFFIRRSADAKDIEFILSRPITRLQLVGSYTLSFVLLSVLMGAAQAIGLMILSGEWLLSTAQWVWIGSIIAENMMMTSTAMFFAMILNSAATAALATTGLYVLARMIGQILGIIHAKADFPGSEMLGIIMQAISIVIPRLDLFAQSSWLVYGLDSDFNLWLMPVQTIMFSALVFVATSVDLVRRQF